MAARVGAPAPGRPPPNSPSRPPPRRALADGHGLPEDKRPERSRPYVLHENANLICLPLLCVACFAGLFGVADCWRITVVFTAYILGDLLWIIYWPESLPRFPLVIKVHHLITLALLSHPLRYPQDARFTCLDGLVELSTFFMVARRQCTGTLSAALNALYWFSTIALRFGLQPYLLYRFNDFSAAYPPLDRFIIMASQSCLCVFNLGLVSVAVNQKLEQRKRRLSGLSLKKN
jgi:hypothetical protein